MNVIKYREEHQAFLDPVCPLVIIIVQAPAQSTSLMPPPPPILVLQVNCKAIRFGKSCHNT